MTLGENLQKLRKAKGLSQEEVAQRLFVSRQSVSKWENDGAEPGVENLKALAGLYGVTLDVLLGSGPREEPEEKEPEPCTRWYQAVAAVWTIEEVCTNLFTAATMQSVHFPFNWLCMLIGLKIRKWPVWAGILSMTLFNLLMCFYYGPSSVFGLTLNLLALAFCLHSKTRAYFYMEKKKEK